MEDATKPLSFLQEFKQLAGFILLLFSCGMAAYSLYEILLATIEYGDDMALGGAEAASTFEACIPV